MSETEVLQNEQITLIEAELAIDLVEKYRKRTGLGDDALATQIATAASQSSGLRGRSVTKSILYNWRHGLSSPQTSHLPALEAFFKSRRFRKVVPEVEHLWNALNSTIRLGTELLRWLECDSFGSTSEIDGVWLGLHINTDKELTGTFTGVTDNWYHSYFRFQSIKGHNFGVAHTQQFWARSETEDDAPLLFVPQSGYIFNHKGNYKLTLRNRLRKEGVDNYLLQRARSLKDSHGETCWILTGDPNPYGQFVLTRTINCKGIFDSFLWSVLPHGQSK